jgi:hypothetical protein
MKTLLTPLLLLILVSACDLSEKTIKKDADIMTQIREAGVYVPMDNEAKLTPLLEKSTKNVIAFMDRRHMNRSNYFLVDGEYLLSDDLKYMMIPIRHYNSIAYDYQRGRDMDAIIKNHALSKQGNSDKTDGYLLLNNKTNQVDGFQPW